MTHWGRVTTGSNQPTQKNKPVVLEVEELPPIPHVERNIAEGIRGLYQKCQMYDLNLVVGKHRFPAHKAVLASMSEAFCQRVRQAVADYETHLKGTAALDSSASPAVTNKETSVAEEAPTPGNGAAPAPAAAAPAPGAAGLDVLPGPAIYCNQWKESTPEAPAASESTPNMPAAAPEGLQESPAAETAATPGADVASSAPVPAAGETAQAPTAVPPPTLTRPELYLDFIESPEAAQAMLDVVYQMNQEYNPSSEEANKDVLRLAQQLDLPRLEELATRKLAEDLTTENVVPRLSTCKEFELSDMYDSIEEEVVANQPALVQVSATDEVIQHPVILQSLLVRSAKVHRPVAGSQSSKTSKRALDEPKPGRPEKQHKASQGRALAGGA